MRQEGVLRAGTGREVVGRGRARVLQEGWRGRQDGRAVWGGEGCQGGGGHPQARRTPGEDGVCNRGSLQPKLLKI